MSLFNKFTKKIFGTTNSNLTAKNRLQMVLVQDRSGMTQQDMDDFKKELIDVICKYFVLESKALEVEWKRDNNETALIINTPVMGRPITKAKIAPATVNA
jgi:cell division topological specificity factor